VARDRALIVIVRGRVSRTNAINLVTVETRPKQGSMKQTDGAL
jgi:hypothetical protein